MRICGYKITATWLQNYGFSIYISILNAFENLLLENYDFSKCILIECQTTWLSKPKYITGPWQDILLSEVEGAHVFIKCKEFNLVCGET
jgi:hypothetical protein